MTKEEILALSRKENSDGDEREKHIILRSHSISTLTGFCLCFLVNALTLFFDGPRIIFPVSWLILWGMLASAMWIQSKGKTDRSKLTVAILFTVIALLHGISFLVQLINW